MEVTGVFLSTTDNWTIKPSLEKSKRRVLFYDSLGQRHEKEIRKADINEAMAKFNLPSIAVKRSTGGYSPARAVKLLIVDPNPQDPESVPQFMIRVHFTDIQIRSGSAGHQMVVYENSVKDVDPSDVVAIEPGNIQAPSRFVLDLGNGPVPIHVFDYAIGWDGLVMALFIEIDDLKELITGQSGEGRFMPTFQVRADALRHLSGDPDSFKEEYRQAYANYYIQKTSGVFKLPKSLLLGQRLQVPCGKSYADVAHYLRSHLKYDKVA
ncbi:MAG: hypothetical protein KDD39_14405 [Bdellovibrionales bacterium]|nr:hypothetical protein [Bdellovibrionales bacterium]